MYIYTQSQLCHFGSVMNGLSERLNKYRADVHTPVSSAEVPFWYL